MKNYQSFADGAIGFLEDLKPFISLAPDPYSNLAAGTINLFFVLAQRRQHTDDVIGSTINGLKERLPDLRKYQEIYDDSDESHEILRVRITIAYIDFVDFAIEASRYYLRPGYARWTRSVFKSREFGDLADEVQTSFFFVRLICERLLHVNVSEIREGNSRLQEQNNDLRREIAELRKDGENVHLNSLKDRLGLSEWSQEGQKRDLAIHANDLRRENDNDELTRPMTDKDIKKYQTSAEFEEWLKPERPSMLLITTRNHYAASGRFHCWMSSFTIHLIRQYSDAGSDLIFYVFNVLSRTEVWIPMRELLFQLMRMCKGTLLMHKSREALSATIGQFQQSLVSDTSFDKIKILERALMIAIGLVQRDQVVYVILDRIDRCREGEKVTFLDILIRLMEEANCVIKILASANTEFWATSRQELRSTQRSSVVENFIEQPIMSLE